MQFKSKTKASGIHLSTHQKQLSSKETNGHDDRTFTRNGADVVFRELEKKKKKYREKLGVVS